MTTPPAGVERNHPLARLTTVRTGGTAEYFARPRSARAVVELLHWAGESGMAVGVVGSGSNLLVADVGVRGLVMKLDGHLTETEFDATHVTCGGGVRLPRLAARTAEQGLSGLEFAVNIPGTVGGAVRMNANAYGGELASTLQWVDVATGTGVERRTPDQFDFAYRSSNLGPDEVVTRAHFELDRLPAAKVKATLAQMRDQRRAAQPSGIKTFGSTFVNPDDARANGRTAGQLLEAAGCKGLANGGARFSPKHANFIENHDDATTDDVIGLIALGRRRVHEQTGVWLEPEVQTLGEVGPRLWEQAP
jgi:UDP-N-acetylmuramate dehydrogenase